MATRAREEGGFGLAELVIAMSVMTVAVMALVAGFSAGFVSINKASRTGTAGTLADKQMEAYRAIAWSDIALNDSLSTTANADTRYNGDTAFVVSTRTDCTTPSPPACGVVPSAACDAGIVSCQPVQASVVGPGGDRYRIDTYIVWSCGVGTLGGTQLAPTCKVSGATASRAVKRVTVVVRDATVTSRTYFRETSTFDEAL